MAMNVMIHFFSGTGNTARAVGRLAENLRREGHVVGMTEVKAGVCPPAGEFDRNMFAWPTLGLGAPSLMRRYLRRLPPGNGVRVAVLALTGGNLVNGKMRLGRAGIGLEQAAVILRRRGYAVFLAGSVAGPDNFTQIMNPPGGEEARQVFAATDPRVDDFGHAFTVGESAMPAGVERPLLLARVVNLLFSLVGRRVLGKLFIADGRCNGCGLCAKSCPARAIRMAGRWPHWRANCEDCCRCINLCPKKAIQLSVPMLVAHFATQAVLVVLGALAAFAWLPPLFAWPLLAGVFIFSFLFIFTVGDRLLRLLAFIPPVRRFFGLGWTRRFRRYVAPGFKP